MHSWSNTKRSCIRSSVRAHTLLRCALSKVILEDLCKTNAEFASLVKEKEDSDISYMLNIDEIQKWESFQRIVNIFENKLFELEKQGKTAKLWVQYFRMVSILKDFIAAEWLELTFARDRINDSIFSRLWTCLLYTSRCV